MWRSSWAIYSACVWHWPVEQCDRSKDCSLGCRKIPNRRTPDTHQHYCIVPCSCHGPWIARKAVPLPARKPPSIYSNGWGEPRHRKILIWQRPLDLPWDLSHLICYCICCQCRISSNASSKIETISVIIAIQWIFHSIFVAFMGKLIHNLIFRYDYEQYKIIVLELKFV